MHGVEGDVVDSVDERLVFGVGLAVSAVAFEGEVVAGERVSMWVEDDGVGTTYAESFSSTYLRMHEYVE